MVSFFVIEKPFRNRQKIRSKYALSFILFASIAVLIVNFGVLMKIGSFNRFPILEILYKNNEFDTKKLFDKRQKFISSICKPFKCVDSSKNNLNQNFRLKVIIIGDSYGEDTYSALYQNREKFQNFHFREKVIFPKWKFLK